jgi:sialate O-acetylesterase
MLRGWKRVAFAVATAVLLFVPTRVDANARLSSLFNDHMVLQRDVKIPIWGWAAPNEPITVTFEGITTRINADPNGNWRVYLRKAEATSTPQTLTVKANNTIELTDVLVGDVWVCSGQSNMEFRMSNLDHADQAIAAAHDPELRFFSVVEATSIIQKDDVKAFFPQSWEPCRPEVAQHFTAVGYYFGRELRKHLNVPIGLIDSSAGGSSAQMWTSVESIQSHVNLDPEFSIWLKERLSLINDYPERLARYGPIKARFDEASRQWWHDYGNSPEFLAKMAAWTEADQKARQEGHVPPPRPNPAQPRPVAPEPPDGGQHGDFMVGNLYNAMIGPMMPLAIKGVAWYQGESNEHASKQYRVLFPLLITDWRANWGEGNFPFLFVQLPNLNRAAKLPVQDRDMRPGLREAQAMALSLPDTGMATTIDIGDPFNVHCKDKQDVGIRLALAARHVAYGEDIVYSGPAYDSMKVDGNSIRISFNNVGSGLTIGVPPWTLSGVIPPPAAELQGFAIAGQDRKWAWAKARVDGDQVVVSSDQVPNPVAVRYAWADNPACNLYNKEKLPASPFRTDDWEAQ